MGTQGKHSAGSFIGPCPPPRVKPHVTTNVDHDEKWLDLKNTYNLGGKLAVSTAGIVMIAFGIAVCRFGGVGVDAYTAMNIGLSETLGMSLGNFQLIVNLVILAAVFFLDKYQIGIGTIVNLVAVGYLVDFFSGVLGVLPAASDSIVGMGACLVAGTLVFTFGISLYLKSGMGVAPYDAVAPIIHERTGWPYAPCRVGQDIAVMAAAFFVGGPVGVFTPVAAFATGPLITWWNNQVTRRLYRRFHVLNDEEMKDEFGEA